MQLFCFTFAGGTTAFYNQLEKEFESKIELVKLEYAGYGTRHKEAFYKNFKELGDDLYSIIKERCKGEEYALLGYSMGSISATEILKRILCNSEIPMPKHMFLAAHEPISQNELLCCADSKIDEYVKKHTISFGGVPKQLISNNSFWRMYLPIYRADYSIIAKYKFENLDIKASIPTTIFYSEKDTTLEKMQLWKKYYTGMCEFVECEGNHFFMHDNYQQIAQIIKERLGV